MRRRDQWHVEAGIDGSRPRGDVRPPADFLDRLKDRKETHCPVETGHRSTTTTLLARIAFMRKRLLQWDPKAERVTNDEEANKLLGYDYRKPWKLG